MAVIDRVLYPGWGATVAAILGLRATHLPLVIVGMAVPAVVLTGPAVLAAVCGGLAAAEGGMAAGRMLNALFRRDRVRKGMVAHTRTLNERAVAPTTTRESVLAKAKHRPGGKRQAVAEWDEPKAARTTASCEPLSVSQASLARRICQEKLEAADDLVARRIIAVVRDNYVQSLGATATFVNAYITLTGIGSNLLHLVSVLGGVFGIMMSLAHIGSGLRLRQLASKALVALQAKREALGRNRFMATLRGPVDPQAAAALCDTDISAARIDRVRSVMAAYRMASLGCDDMLAEREQLRRDELRHANMRVAYGLATLLTNGALLTLTILGLTSFAATTAGLGLLVVAAGLGLAWLIPMIRRILAGPPRHLSSEWQAGESAKALLDATPGDDPCEMLERACRTAAERHESLLASGAHAEARQLRLAHRWLLGGMMVVHLREATAEGSADVAEAALQARMAESVLLALGVDRAMIGKMRGATTPEEVEVALKMVRRLLAGEFVDTSVLRRQKPRRSVSFGASINPVAGHETEPLLGKTSVA
ncbi:hypothetical protein [Paracidovorax citrulli]